VKSVTTQRAILVVEADRALRDSITWTLRRDAYVVLAVPDGATALEVAQANPFSLILLDPMGLQPDGPDTCRQLRAFPKTAFVPILMLVTDEADITRMVILDLGVDDYITKPLKFEVLRACVRALLRGSNSRPARTWNRPVKEAKGGGRAYPGGGRCLH
jgi:DNA-binding response OmpR family regulator